jgi:hypothetical protein
MEYFQLSHLQGNALVSAVCCYNTVLNSEVSLWKHYWQYLWNIYMPYQARHLCRKKSVKLTGHPVTAAILCTDKPKLCTEQDNILS